LQNQHIDLFSYKAHKPIYIDTRNPNIGREYIIKTIPNLAITDTKPVKFKIGLKAKLSAKSLSRNKP